MKHINTKIENFISEGRFTKISEPIQIQWEDMRGKTRNHREFWEKDEMSDIVDFLESNGYEVIDIRPRFMPLSIKSRLPVSPYIIAAYLKCPLKPLGKQMFIRARVRD